MDEVVLNYGAHLSFRGKALDAISPRDTEEFQIRGMVSSTPLRSPSVPQAGRALFSVSIAIYWLCCKVIG